jgi:ABC-2 type transport system permease protein
MKKILTIIRKEWMEVFQNRLVIFTVIFLPLLMTAIPLAILYSMQGGMPASAGNSVSGEIPTQMAAVCSSGMSGTDCLRVYILSQFLVLFMIIPVTIPGAIAAYSVVGEKTTHSLEPLLATPITTLELLLGKCLSAVIPAVMATYLAYGIFVLGTWIILPSPAILAFLFQARWLIAVFVVGPLLALMAVTFALMVSSRVNDPRVAEQISVIIIVPVLAGFFGQISGVFVLNQGIISVTALILAGFDALMFYLATRLFQRETILTRWK